MPPFYLTVPIIFQIPARVNFCFHRLHLILRFIYRIIKPESIPKEARAIMRGKRLFYLACLAFAAALRLLPAFAEWTLKYIQLPLTRAIACLTSRVPIPFWLILALLCALLLIGKRTGRSRNSARRISAFALSRRLRAESGNPNRARRSDRRAVRKSDRCAERFSPSPFPTRNRRFSLPPAPFPITRANRSAIMRSSLHLRKS